MPRRGRHFRNNITSSRHLKDHLLEDQDYLADVCKINDPRWFDSECGGDPRWLYVSLHAATLIMAAVQGFNHAKGNSFPNSNITSLLYYGAPIAQVAVTTGYVTGSLLFDQVREGKVRGVTQILKDVCVSGTLTGIFSSILGGLELAVGYGLGYAAGGLPE